MSPEGGSQSSSRIRWAVDVRPGEVRGMLLAFSFFFLVLCGYYILRPIRDEMGAADAEKLPFFFTATFVAMLAAVPAFAALASRAPPVRLVRWVYRFFASNLLLFFLLFRSELAPRAVVPAFFVWVSVYNLFIVSLFWSVMADLFRREQGKRLYGFIAAGGTLGGVAGSALTSTLAEPVGPLNLMLLSALFLEGAVQCVKGLGRWQSQRPVDPDEVTGAARNMETAVGGGLLAGMERVARSPVLLAICAYVLVLSVTNTFLYNQQAEILNAAQLSRGERTALFARINLFVNALAVVTQLFATGKLLKRLGVTFGIAFLPLFSGVGFGALALNPSLWMVSGFQGLRRAAQFAVERPSRELLFTTVPREDKYKSKSFIDTVVFRGGDALSAWLFTLMQAVGLSLTGIAWLSVPLCAAWMALGLYVGRKDASRGGAEAGAAAKLESSA